MKNKLSGGLASLFVAGLLVTGTVGAQEMANNAETLKLLVDEGAPLYSDNCAGCHGAEGEGGVGPSLVGTAKIKSRSALIFQILFGATDHGMPPFVDVLSDQEIAAVATYVRNSWTNESGIVLPRSVELRRTTPPEVEAEAD